MSFAPPSSSARIERQRALRHYERAITALRGEPYRGIPPALRADLVYRLTRDRDALVQQMTRPGKGTCNTAPPVNDGLGPTPDLVPE